MALPDLTEHGLLPEGVHDATLEEIGQRFGSSNDRRRELFEKLSAFCKLLEEHEFPKELYADGSFTTDKPIPSDVDLVLETPRDFLPRMIGAMAPGRPLNPATVKARFDVHLYGQFDQGVPWGMVVWFQRMRSDEALGRAVALSHRRGIVRVVR